MSEDTPPSGHAGHEPHSSCGVRRPFSVLPQFPMIPRATGLPRTQTLNRTFSTSPSATA